MKKVRYVIKSLDNPGYLSKHSADFTLELNEALLCEFVINESFTNTSYYYYPVFVEEKKVISLIEN